MTNPAVRRWRMRRRPDGPIAAGDFVLETVALPTLGEGQVLTQTRFISLDPYLARMMRTWEGPAPGWSEGFVHGRVIAQVIRSRSPRLVPGDVVLGFGRWQERDIFDAAALQPVDTAPAPPQAALGVLGASGLTAWVGLRLGRVKAGETVLVSSAAGPVGSVAGQLARLYGCRAVGAAGGEDKCRYVVERLGFDACVDHHGPHFEARLAAALPEGIDVLFENVGGPSLDPALPLMRKQGRIMLCGLVAHYDDDAPLTLANFKALLYSQLELRGFATADHPELFAEALAALRAGLASGAICYDETIIDGIDRAPAAYIDMLKGGGLGKRLVRVSV